MADTYTNGKLNKYKETAELVASIEIAIKALGTMVIFPEYKSDPNAIGSKVYSGSIQQPILLDKDREVAMVKLTELIAQL